MNILGFSCYYHDAAACLVKNGELIAAMEEERVTRKKHDNGFPINSMEHCLNLGNIVAQELDAVVFHEKSLRKLYRIVDRHIRHYPFSYKHFRMFVSRWFSEILNLDSLLARRLNTSCRMYSYPHHLAHAAASYFLSPFDEAAILVIDAVGEAASTSWGTASRGRGITLNAEIPYPHSLGMLYTTITNLLGFDVMEGEGTVMGLAAHGEPTLVHQLSQVAHSFPDGSMLLKPEYFAFDCRNRMYAPKLEKLLAPARSPDAPIEQIHKDIAASLQAYLEERILTIAAFVREQSGMKNLCYSGGVALNSAVNGKLAQSGIFDAVFIPSAPGDSGAAVGAALLHAFYNSNGDSKPQPIGADLGPKFSRQEIQNYFTMKGIPYEIVNDEAELLDRIAAALAKFKTVGWFQDRMEFGPRALGNRSILAHPGQRATRDQLNLRIKGREDFRPFGAAVLEEEAPTLFRDPVSSPYMQFVVPIRDEAVETLQALVHADGTCRIQTAPSEPSTRFRRLLERFYRETGIPAVLNTSFNMKGEPIVCTPREAYECYIKAGLDLLVVDNFILAANGAS